MRQEMPPPARVEIEEWVLNSDVPWSEMEKERKTERERERERESETEIERQNEPSIQYCVKQYIGEILSSYDQKRGQIKC